MYFPSAILGIGFPLSCFLSKPELNSKILTNFFTVENGDAALEGYGAEAEKACSQWHRFGESGK